MSLVGDQTTASTFKRYVAEVLAAILEWENTVRQ